MRHFGDRVGLGEVLSRVANIVDDAQIRLKDCPFVLELRFEFELVTERRFARCEVGSSRHVDFIQHVVVKVVFVRPDARLLVRIYPQRRHQHLDAVFILYEGVNVGGIGGRITYDERRVHVAGGEGRRGQQRRQHSGHAAMQGCYLLHKCFSSLCLVCGFCPVSHSRPIQFPRVKKTALAGAGYCVALDSDATPATHAAV